MRENTDLHEISYHEYRVIARLLRAHLEAYQDRLKAMVAFGDLVTTGETFDIELLEIIEGWEDKRFGEFSRSEDLPLRGSLRLYFLTPEEAENPAVIEDAEEQKWVRELLERVRKGYEVIMESPPGRARRLLDQVGLHSTLTPPPSGSVTFTDPYKLPASRK